MQTLEDHPVIVSAKRTPMGHFGGYFKNTPAPALGAHAIKACLADANLSAEMIDEVIMGCILTAGIGQAPARQAALLAEIPHSAPCTTINKMCGSGMKAVMQACDGILAGSNQAYIAGGMENMSLAPYLLPGARFGYRMGNQTALDHMMHDGLTDAYAKHLSMGQIAEQCAEKFNITREQQDQFAIQSISKATNATLSGAFGDEISPIILNTKKEEVIYSEDEGISKANPEKIPQLKPAFSPNGTITAANASSISDGAATLIVMQAARAEALNVKPLARIVGYTGIALQPEWFTTAPIDAIKKLLDKLEWSIDSVDLFEINEAFAVVTLAAIQNLKIPTEKVNVHGGACILGHPIGASGARIIVTLIHALRQQNKKRGIAALCIGGGEATAIGVEII